MTVDLLSPLSRSIANGALGLPGGGRFDDDGPPAAGANASAAALHQKFAQRSFHLDIVSAADAGDSVHVPAYLSAAFSELKGEAPPELQIFVGLFSLALSGLGYDEDETASMLKALVAPIVEAMNLGAKFGPELIAAAFAQRSMGVAGDGVSLIELAESIDIRIVVAPPGSDDEGQLEDLIVHSDLGARFDLDQSLFPELAGKAVNKAPSLRELIGTSLSVMQTAFAETVGRVELSTGDDIALAAEPKDMSEFAQLARSTITTALATFRQDLASALAGIGIDGKAIGQALSAMTGLVKDALETGKDFMARFMVAAATKTRLAPSAEVDQSIALAARSIAIEVNHETGEVIVDTSDISFNALQMLTPDDAASGAGSDQTEQFNLQDTMAGLEGPMRSALQSALWDMESAPIMNGPHDGPGAPALRSHSSVQISDISAHLNDRQERVSRIVFDFSIRFALPGSGGNAEA